MRSFFDFGSLFIWIGLGAASVLLFFAIYYRPASGSSVFLISLLGCCGALFGIMRMDMAEEKDFLLDKYLGQRATFEGVVMEEPERRERYTRYVASIGNEKILVYDDVFSKVSYGNRVLFEVEVRIPQNFSSENGFLWYKFLERKNIHYEMHYPRVKVLQKTDSPSFLLKQKLFYLKNEFVSHIRAVVPEPEATLGAGITVGERSGFSKELLEAFRNTGIVHIVVLSGYNITIVADTLMKALFFVPRAVSVYAGICIIFLFVVMTGAGAPAVRAGIMAGLVVFAPYYGRIYKIEQALLVSGFFMVLWSPSVLLFDASFQLSFVATLGLIYCAPRIECYLSFITTRLNVRGIFSATLSAQLFVFPLLIAMGGVVSPVSLIVNMLILPIVPLAMFISFLTGVAGFASSGVAYFFGVFATIILKYQFFIVDFFNRMSFW